MDLPPVPLATAEPHAESPASAHHVPTRYRERTGRRAAIFAVAVAVALGLIFVLRHLSSRHEQAALQSEVTRESGAPVPVDVVHVKAGAAVDELSLPAEAHGYYEATIFARTSGYVIEGDTELADIGDHVKEGETLATIETPELDDQLVAAKAKVDQLKAEVHVAQTAVQFAQLSADRWEAAWAAAAPGGVVVPGAPSAPGGAVSKQERDQKLSELESSKAKLESARAQVALGEADVRRLNTLQKFKYVTAPFSGTITRRHVDIGDLVTAGSTNNTSPMFSIVQADKIRVFVDVPQVVASDIKIGMPVTVKTRERRSQSFPGVVDHTAEAINRESRTLLVQVLVNNKSGALRSGSDLQATFHTNRANPPLEVPAAAIDFKPTGPQVAVVSGDGHLSFRDVTIENDMGDRLEVEGLKEGEHVALNVGNGISEGQIVEVHDLDAPAGGAKDGVAAR